MTRLPSAPPISWKARLLYASRAAGNTSKQRDLSALPADLVQLSTDAQLYELRRHPIYEKMSPYIR